MIQFHKKGSDAICRASRQAKRGLICTPYYSERGLSLLDDFFSSADRVEFWTRFSPLDWRAGMADMSALERRVKSVLSRSGQFDIRVADNLHAKIYTFSDDRVILGSANLTWPGMTSNVETVCELTEQDSEAFFTVVSDYRCRLTPVDPHVFLDYVSVASDAVSGSPDAPVEEDEDMNAAIDLAEETLRNSLIGRAPAAAAYSQAGIEYFIDYCRRQNTTASREVVERYEGKHSLQGHVKHCFYGCVRFLAEFPQYTSLLAATPRDSLYSFEDSPLREHWRDFLQEHAEQIDEEHKFSFRTLRVYLPPNLGGICVGGGGGSGTLKRVLPLVARMLNERGQGFSDD